ncbi:MAG: 3-hydroxyacyl-ACP dehydratase FabZ [Acidobacteriia bacterium]|nr:3-hydroxyacyl-ACP dehydratase FabZ [Terriglobia bacterium]
MKQVQSSPSPASTAPVLGFEQIRDIMVHRFPFLMLDRVTVLEKGSRLVAIKNITGNEIWFLGHFPKQAIMPGVLMIEAMAQAASLLDTLSRDDVHPEAARYLGRVEAQFQRMIVPGDVMEIEVVLLKQISYAVIAKSHVRVDGNIACSAELMLGTKAPDREK